MWGTIAASASQDFLGAPLGIVGPALLAVVGLVLFLISRKCKS